MRSRFFRVALAAVSAIAAACSDSTTAAGTGQLTVQLTDAPVGSIQSAVVFISRIYLIGGSDSTGSQITISSTPAQYDVLNFQGAVTAALGSATVPVGTYTQMRLKVDSARITLVSPLTFSTGGSTKTLVIPSGQQTGVKVVFGGPVTVVPGETILVVDFDVSRNFVLTGPASAPTGAIFKPVLHATVRNVAASVAGTVTPASAKATLAAVTAANDTVATAIADTLTGTYKLWFLPPGTYTVTATGTAPSTLALSKVITVRAAQDTTGVNFP